MAEGLTGSWGSAVFSYYHPLKGCVQAFGQQLPAPPQSAVCLVLGLLHQPVLPRCGRTGRPSHQC